MQATSALLKLNTNLCVLFMTGNFRAGEQGTILKKLCPKETTCLQELMLDVLRPYVPEYKADVLCDGNSILYRLRLALITSLGRVHDVTRTRS